MSNKKILTRDVLAQIPAMLASGRYSGRQAIADALGCKVSSLSVRCSQHGISLRPPRGVVERRIRLDPRTAERLRERAERYGETEESLVRRLLETIVHDDLYEAVLDEQI